MFCKWCGNSIQLTDKKCPACGRETPPMSDCGGLYNLKHSNDGPTAPTKEKVIVKEVPHCAAVEKMDAKYVKERKAAKKHHAITMSCFIVILLAIVCSALLILCNTWTNVESLYTAGSWFGPLALTKDGKVLCADNGLDLSSWSDIVQIGTAMGRVLGLRRDSTVLCADRDGTTIMEGWTDVVSVDGDWDIMALRSDGTILTTATEVYGTPLDFSDWNNLVAIAVDGYTYIGLKNDGTLITNGGFDYLGAVPDFSQWTNLVEFKIHGYNIMGLKADGTVLGYSDSNPNQETFFTDVQLPD